MTDSSRMGAHIPLIYHFAMLQDQQRMEGFREAISLMVAPGARVLELGGGTGVLSFFAAQRASKVYCVEQIPENARAARELLDGNRNGDRVEVICADAFEYLPPEPVDVVICEMLHVAMARENQIAVIESFKRRYLKRFGGKLPRFVPEAFLQGIQPISYNFNFFGYRAAIPLFEAPGAPAENCREMGDPVIYQMAQYSDALSERIEWTGNVALAKAGTVNALRFILKNLLAIIPEQNRAVNWHNHYLVIPLSQPIEVSAGDKLSVQLSYQTGCEIEELQKSIHISRIVERPPLAARVEIIPCKLPQEERPLLSPEQIPQLPFRKPR